MPSDRDIYNGLAEYGELKESSKEENEESRYNEVKIEIPNLPLSNGANIEYKIWLDSVLFPYETEAYFCKDMETSLAKAEFNLTLPGSDSFSVIGGVVSLGEIQIKNVVKCSIGCLPFSNNREVSITFLTNKLELPTINRG